VKIDEIDIYSTDFIKVLKILQQDPPILFLGIAVSMWPPTNIPSGIHIQSLLFDYFFSDFFNNKEAKEFKELWKNIPFENIFENCPQINKIGLYLQDYFNISKFNSIHIALADAMDKGLIKHVISPNYDLCLDVLLRGKKDISIIRNETDYGRVRNRKKVYFKIHGSADDPNIDNLVFTLSQEGKLLDWKKELLYDLVENKNLLIIGYSGLDFDICPELMNIKIKNVFWNFRNSINNGNDLTFNAQSLLNKKNGQTLIGDLRDLVEKMFFPVCKDNVIFTDFFQKNLVKCISNSDRLIWRSNIFNSIGCPGFTLRTIDDLKNNNVDLGYSLNAEAQGYFNSGKYKKAAKIFGNSKNHKNLTVVKMIEFTLIASNAWLCYGNILWAIKFLIKAYKMTKKLNDDLQRSKSNAECNLKELFIWEAVSRVMGKFLRNGIPNIFKRRIIKLLNFSGQIFNKTGQYYLLQQIYDYMKLLNLKESDLNLSFDLKPSNFSYRHLGYFLAESMAWRRLIKEKRNILTEDDFKYYWKYSIKLEIHPEIWKLARLGLESSIIPKKRELTENFQASFYKCEHSRLGRLALKLTH